MTNRLIIGLLPNGNYGIRISKPGYDVTTEPPDQQSLHFNTDWPSMLPAYVRGSTSTNSTTVNVSYGVTLGFYPYCSILCSTDNSTWEVFNLLMDMRIAPDQLGDMIYEGGAQPAFPIAQVKMTKSQISFYSNSQMYWKYSVFRIPAST